MAETNLKQVAQNVIPDDPEASAYRFIIVAAKRARQLQGGARSMLPTTSKKPTVAAMEEVRRGLVPYEDIGDSEDIRGARRRIAGNDERRAGRGRRHCCLQSGGAGARADGAGIHRGRGDDARGGGVYPAADVRGAHGAQGAHAFVFGG